MSREYYTEARYPNQLPINTPVEVIVWGKNKHVWHGRKGIVRGYFGSFEDWGHDWHCIQFEHEPLLPLKDMPYVNRVYLKELEKAQSNES